MVSAVIGAIPSILMAVGMWLFYTTCRNTQSGNVSTVGLTICKVITIINLVLLCCVVLFLVAMVMIFIIAFAGMGEINYYSYSDGYYGATSAAFVITLLVIVSLIVAAVLALVIAYQVSILRAINRIKGSALNGAPDNRISRFLTGFMMVIGVLTCLGGLFSLIASPVAGIASLASGGVLRLMSLLLGEYRAKMTMLLYPPVQPTYSNMPPLYQRAAPAARRPPRPQPVNAHRRKEGSPPGAFFFLPKSGEPLSQRRRAPHAFASCILLYVPLLDDPHLYNGLQSPQRFHGGGGELPGDVQNCCRRIPPGTCSACSQC